MRSASIFAATDGKLLRLEIDPARLLESTLDANLAIAVMENVVRSISARLEIPTLFPRTAEAKEHCLRVRVPTEAERLFQRLLESTTGGAATAAETREAGLVLDSDHRHERFWFLESGVLVRDYPEQNRRAEFYGPCLVGVHAALSSGTVSHRFLVEKAVTLRRVPLSQLKPRHQAREAIQRYKQLAGLLIAQIEMIEQS